MADFDPSKLRKLKGKRYLNVRQEPKPGSTWLYFDSEREGEVQWKINAINNDGSVSMTKQSGDSVGYTVDWPITEFNKSKWKPAVDDDVTYLWACPDCDRHRPILVGDYVCIDCREGLDTE